MGEAIEITPSAARLTASLRDIGYSFVTALADIVDNSVTAGASRVEIAIRFHGRDSFVVISDNGSGMGPSALNEALRFGTRRSYRPGDLGRFGLGLKTASLSQARRLMVISRASRKNRRLHCRVLDIDRVERTDRWEVLAHSPNELAPELVESLRNGPGTIVVWDRLDRVLDYADPGGAWAKRHLERLAAEASDYLAMVFPPVPPRCGGPRASVDCYQWFAVIALGPVLAVISWNKDALRKNISDSKWGRGL